MMSKPSFWIDLKENCKRRLWPLLLFSILQVFSYPIGMAIVVQNVHAYSYDENIKQELIRAALSNMNSVFGLFVAMLAGFLLAMQGYGYVYHKERVDMLQAQPVSPRRRFGVIYVGGLLVWFVPTVL